MRSQKVIWDHYFSQLLLIKTSVKKLIACKGWKFSNSLWVTWRIRLWTFLLNLTDKLWNSRWNCLNFGNLNKILHRSAHQALSTVVVWLTQQLQASENNTIVLWNLKLLVVLNLRNEVKLANSSISFSKILYLFGSDYVHYSILSSDISTRVVGIIAASL